MAFIGLVSPLIMSAVYQSLFVEKFKSKPGFHLFVQKVEKKVDLKVFVYLNNPQTVNDKSSRSFLLIEGFLI